MERVVKRLAWPIAIVSGALTAAGLVLLGLTFDRPSPELWGFRGFPAIFAIETAILGGLIMSRRPGNVIGALLAWVGLTSSVQLFLSQYLVAGTDWALAGVAWAAWINAFIWIPTVAVLLGFVPLFFPDGHLLSARWRPVVWLIAVGMVGLIGTTALSPNVGNTGSTFAYPFGSPLDPATASVVWSASWLISVSGVVLYMASLWLRWRRSSGVEREQLKWLAWAGGLVVVTIPFANLPFKLTQAIFILTVATVPLAVGIAVLRYRLYEIDAVISRTLVYGALTAILAGLFAGLQRLLQGAFVTVTGNESDAAWAISALILAGSFAPLKGALERVVARRFKDPKAGEAGAGGGPAVVTASAAWTAAGGGEAGEDLEAMLRRVVREELAVAMPPTDDG